MGAFKKERKMKVYEATTVSQNQGYMQTKYKSVPQIRLQGLWLEKLGFESGVELKVECWEGKIIITPKED